MRRWRLPFTGAELWLGLSIAAADQITKALVSRSLALHETVEIVPGLVNLVHVRNTGAAFGLLNAADFPYKPVVVVLMAVVALTVITLYAGRFGSETPAARLGLVLIVAGALGNLVDRATMGYVVDFVDVYWGGAHFWAFNVADASITVGAALLILDMLFAREHVSTTA